MNGPSRFFASICVALVIAVSTAALHADTDPANDNSVGAEALNLTPGTATLESAPWSIRTTSTTGASTYRHVRP